MTGAIRMFGKLGPKTKALYIASLVLSVALVVFGVVLLTWPESAGSSSIISTEENARNSLGGGDSSGSDFGHVDNEDDDDNDGMISWIDDDGEDEDGISDDGISVEAARPSFGPIFTTWAPTTPWPTNPPSVDSRHYPTATPSMADGNTNLRPASTHYPMAIIWPTETTPPGPNPSPTPTSFPTTSPSGPAVGLLADIPTTDAPFSFSRTPSDPPTDAPVSTLPTKSPLRSPSRVLSDPPTDAPVSSLPTKSPLRSTSSAPSDHPTDAPVSPLPTKSPFHSPSIEPSDPPSSSVSPTQSNMPTTPLFPTHNELKVGSNSKDNWTYFNYNTTTGASYGPNAWENVTVLNSTADNYWSEFGFVENQCNSDKFANQSPIDVCTKPERHCEEYHEFRSRRGDFKISGDFMIKQILPSKLRVLVTRRTGDEPDPPHVDFAGIGAKELDMLNIDIKFPSEHTVCGRRFDGEMQYYFFHPVKKSLVVLSWLFEVKEEVDTGNDDDDDEDKVNEHMQALIDEFQDIYNRNEDICVQKSMEEQSSLMNETMSSATRFGAEPLENTGYNTTTVNPPLRRRAKQYTNNHKGVWDPFHRDIQKTIHFWGYTGTLTEPPCAAGTLWRIMDVPVRITKGQLYQMQNILFNNRDGETCEYTSTHYRGSVARPSFNTTGSKKRTKYYKCTRSDYASDAERNECGDAGCADNPRGTGLNPYVEPMIYVTGPPSEPPTMQPSSDEIV